jgi:ATP-dependent Clp protease ATP-binding subunit ClpC
MTSNAGMRDISRDSRLGFSSGSGIMSAEEIESQALSELKKLFAPEFINRLDEVVVFKPLNQEQINKIFDIEFGELEQRLGEQNFRIRITEAARAILTKKGWDPKLGGRPMRRTIQKEVEAPLSELILEKTRKAGTLFTVDGSDGEIKLYCEEDVYSGEMAEIIR